MKHYNAGRTIWFSIDRKPWQRGVYECLGRSGRIWRLTFCGKDWLSGISALKHAGITHWRGLTKESYDKARETQ